MTEVEKMMEEVGQIIVQQVSSAIIAANRSATGKTLASLEIVSAPGTMTVLGAKSITALEGGRGPTVVKTPSVPTLFQALKDWCAARGIDDKFRYAIANKIHKEGWKGTPGLLTAVLSDKNVSDVIDEVFARRYPGIINELTLQLFSELNKN